MIGVHASAQVEPDRRAEALELVERLVEQYEDETAFEAHLESEQYRAFVAELPDLLAERPETVRFDVENVTRLEP